MTPEISPNNPEIAKFLSGFEDTTETFDFLIEYSAEVISFKLGYFKNFDLYFKKLWKYIQLYHLVKDNFNIENFILKSFFVKLIHLYSHREPNSLRPSQLNDLDFLYVNLVDYIKEIENYLDIVILDKHFIAAENVKFYRDIWPYAKNLLKIIKNYNLKPKLHKLKLKNTIAIVDSIKNAKIWDDKIISPEAVLYHLMQFPDLPQGSRIAVIMSFWNYEWKRRMGKI